MPATQSIMQEQTSPIESTGAIRKLMDGYGFIAGDDGQDYFFHWSACCADSVNFRDMAIQMRVSFFITVGARGPRAVMVRVL